MQMQIKIKTVLVMLYVWNRTVIAKYTAIIIMRIRILSYKANPKSITTKASFYIGVCVKTRLFILHEHSLLQRRCTLSPFSGDTVEDTIQSNIYALKQS